MEWNKEKECFESFSKECALFYAFKTDPYVGEEITENGHDENWRWTVEHVLFPAFRSGFHPPQRMADDGSILQVANLPDLYKVFERC